MRNVVNHIEDYFREKKTLFYLEIKFSLLVVSVKMHKYGNPRSPPNIYTVNHHIENDRVKRSIPMYLI